MPAVGSNAPQAKNGGTWKNWSKFWAKHGGSWKRPISVFVKSGGTWKEVWDETPTVVSSSTYYIEYNGGAYTRAWKVANVNANGFAATVTASATDFFQTPEVDVTPGSIAIDDTVEVKAYAQYIGNYQGSFPTITITNSSGTVTV